MTLTPLPGWTWRPIQRNRQAIAVPVVGIDTDDPGMDRLLIAPPARRCQWVDPIDGVLTPPTEGG